MTQADVLRDVLMKDVKSLSEDYIQEIIDFTEFIIEKRTRSNKTRVVSHDKNLWNDFIGGVEHGSLAQNIDKDLYE